MCPPCLSSSLSAGSGATKAKAASSISSPAKPGSSLAIQAGNNAGHTIVNERGEFKLHLVPAGIFYPDKTCVIGNGVAVDPEVLLGEIGRLQSKGIDTSRLVLSDRAQVIMPWHVAARPPR